MKRAILANLLALCGLGRIALAQTAPPPFDQAPLDQAEPSYQTGQAPQQQMLSPQELDNLVAPVALYPDPVLGQVLAASTYPLEIVEAQQWLQQNGNLPGAQRVDAARQQNWDPSVQALVAFPDVLTMLNRDIRWTTDLGNAFLNQQADVMAAIQRMRGRAHNNGRLRDTPQQTIEADAQNDIAIQPADPQVVYVPTYDPAYVWGPPAYGAYPAIGYPSFGFGWGPAAFLGSLFTGFLGFGGWGWALNWLAHGLFFNGLFFNHFGYHGYGGGYGGGYARNVAWAHNPSHRLGVPYSSRAVASRYSGVANGGWRGFNNGAVRGQENASRGFQQTNRMAEGYRGSAGGYRSSDQAFRGSSYGGAQRVTPGYGNAARPSYNSAARAPAQNYARSYSARNDSAPRASSQHYSAPHYSAPHASGGHVSAPHASHQSSGHSGGGHSGGGHSGGGGHQR